MNIFAQMTDDDIAEARSLLLDPETPPELQITSLLTLIDKTKSYGSLALYYNQIATVYGLKLNKRKIANWYFGKAGMAGVEAILVGEEFEPGLAFVVRKFSTQGYLYGLENQNKKACKCYKTAYDLAESTTGTDDQVSMDANDLMWYIKNCKD